MESEHLNVYLKTSVVKCLVKQNSISSRCSLFLSDAESLVSFSRHLLNLYLLDGETKTHGRICSAAEID